MSSPSIDEKGYFYPFDSGCFDCLVCTGDHEDEVVKIFSDSPSISEHENKVYTTANGRQWNVAGNPGVSGDGSYFARWSKRTSFSKTPRIAFGLQSSHTITVGLLAQKQNILNGIIKGGLAVFGYLTFNFHPDEEKGHGWHVEAHDIGPGNIVVMFDFEAKEVKASVNGSKAQNVELVKNVAWPSDAKEELVPFIAFEAEGQVEWDDSDDEDEETGADNKLSVTVMSKEETMIAAAEIAS